MSHLGLKQQSVVTTEACNLQGSVFWKVSRMQANSTLIDLIVQMIKRLTEDVVAENHSSIHEALQEVFGIMENDTNDYPDTKVVCNPIILILSDGEGPYPQEVLDRMNPEQKVWWLNKLNLSVIALIIEWCNGQVLIQICKPYSVLTEYYPKIFSYF